MDKIAPSTWTKSTYSGQRANCVEWRQAHAARQIAVRDSKTGAHAQLLTVPHMSWLAFVHVLAGRV